MQKFRINVILLPPPTILAKGSTPDVWEVTTDEEHILGVLQHFLNGSMVANIFKLGGALNFLIQPTEDESKKIN